MDAQRLYRHSGQVGIMGPVLMSVFGLVAAALGGGLYGVAIVFIPFIYVNVLLTIGLGMMTGWVVGEGARLGKTRNDLVTGLFGLAAALLASYIGWVSYFLALSEFEYLIVSPAALWGTMGALAEQGSWTLFGITASGKLLWTIWGLEALIILGLGWSMASNHLSARPFCEGCSLWTESSDHLPNLNPITEDSDVLERLTRGEYDALAELPGRDEAFADFTELTVATCPRCTAEDYLTIKQVTVETNNMGKEKRTETILLGNLILGVGHLDALERRLSASPD